MQSIDINNLAIIYMTTETNTDRINSYPVQLPFDVENTELEKDLIENFKKTAYQYDMYKDIIQISILWRNCYHHYFFCDDPDISVQDINEEWRHIVVFDYEHEAVRAAVKKLYEICPETAEGIPVGGGLLAGWKVNTDILPILVNKAFKYGLRLPASLMADPMRRWSTVENTLEISNLYGQGISTSVRRIPALADVLNYWGFSSEYVRPDAIREAVCEGPIKAVNMLETYLNDMEIVIQQYYNISPKEQHGK